RFYWFSLSPFWPRYPLDVTDTVTVDSVDTVAVDYAADTQATPDTDMTDTPTTNSVTRSIKETIIRRLLSDTDRIRISPTTMWTKLIRTADTARYTTRYTLSADTDT
ncbi:Uncharacterised protein at_DN0326, partial [Pycnogonum litorale]